MFGLMQKAQERQMALVTESESQALLFFRLSQAAYPSVSRPLLYSDGNATTQLHNGRKAADWIHEVVVIPRS